MIEAYIRQAAIKRGIDPDIAVRVAKSEGGLANPFQQSNVVKNGVRERSYGPFQLYMDGGLGNRALAAGIDPRQNWQGGVDYALDEAAQKGWGQWYGAAKVGVGNYDGIRGAKPVGSYASAPMPNPNERLAGDGMVARNTYPEVAAATTFTPQPPHDASVVAAGGPMTDPGSIDPNDLRDPQESPLKGILSALSQIGDGPAHARMGPMGDARQSGGGLLELLGAGGNPYNAFARKQRGILG